MSSRHNQSPISHDPFSDKIGNNNKIKCVDTKDVTQCILAERSYLANGADKPKGADKTLQSESANQKENR